MNFKIKIIIFLSVGLAFLSILFYGIMKIRHLEHNIHNLELENKDLQIESVNHLTTIETLRKSLEKQNSEFKIISESYNKSLEEYLLDREKNKNNILIPKNKSLEDVLKNINKLNYNDL